MNASCNLWLLRYRVDEFGPPWALTQLMAVAKMNQNNVRSVVYYRYLNQRVDAFTSADVGVHKLKGDRKVRMYLC